MYWFEEIVGYQEEFPLTCPICSGAGYTIDTGGNKYQCGCKNTGGIIITSFPYVEDRTGRFIYEVKN